jgi:hypothetical protein
MQDATASANDARSEASKTVRRKGIPSPYDTYFHIDSLEQEAKRFSLLPRPTMNVDHVMRWRRKQVWLIGLRIRELKQAQRESTT